MMDKLTMDSSFNNEEDDFLDDMVVLQLLENMECLQRSSRKRKHDDILDDNEEDDDEEEDDEDDEEDYDNEEEEDEEDSNCSEQTSASYASDARSPPNLEDPFADLDVPTMENDIKVLRALQEKMRHPPRFMKVVRETLCELNSKLLKETAKLNGGTNGKL